MFIMIILFYLFMMICLLILLLNFLFSFKKKLNRNKFSSFECGFDSLSFSRMPFSIQFFMISIIFLIFDVEIMIFFPFIPSLFLNYMNYSILILMMFIIILIFGLYMEFYNGALKWLI